MTDGEGLEVYCRNKEAIEGNFLYPSDNMLFSCLYVHERGKKKA